MVWEGDDVILTGRKMIGATDPSEARPGTFRGDYGISKGRNGFHGSDSIEASKREIALWFKPDELTKAESVSEPWIYEGPPKKSAQSTVPSLALDKVTPTPDGPKSERVSLRTAGLIGVAAIAVAAIGVGVATARRKAGN